MLASRLATSKEDSREMILLVVEVAVFAILLQMHSLYPDCKSAGLTFV